MLMVCFSKEGKKQPADTALQILELLRKENLSSRDIENSLNITPDEVIFALQLLMENNRIQINKNNKYSLR